LHVPFESRPGRDGGDGQYGAVDTSINEARRQSRRRAGRPSQRQLRVGENLRHALAELLGRHDQSDPVLAAADVTVAEVRISPDLRHAVAFVTELGGGLREEVAAALASAAPWLRGELARRVRLRYAPELTFRADTTFDEAARIEELLARERTILDRVGAADGEDGDGEG
jgi:ribosome-binding factor A